MMNSGGDDNNITTATRSRWRLGLAIVAVMVPIAALVVARTNESRGAPVRVGVLHALTGTLAISERPVVDATVMAIDEINRAGGVLGRRVEPVVVDTRSDWPRAAREAEHLIVDEKAQVVFGCWTSACRKTVRPVFERHHHLLVYPVQYEGLEQSPNIVYTGAAPNQQIIPAVKWSFDHFGRRFYLVGSDYVFPRTANAMIRDQVTALGGEIVGEDYLLLGSTDVRAVVDRIAETTPDVVLNTINGDTNVAFFAALRSAGITPEKIPTMSFSLAEPELAVMGTTDNAGDYAAWNYFQSIGGDRNVDFVARFRHRYGANRVTSDAVEAAYLGVHLWAQGVKEARTVDVADVRAAMQRQSYSAPEGIVYVDPDTQHLWKSVRIGRVTEDRQFSVVWSSEAPIRPVPYPLSRSRAEWEAFLQKLYTGWGDNWTNPG